MDGTKPQERRSVIPYESCEGGLALPRRLRTIAWVSVVGGWLGLILCAHVFLSGGASPEPGTPPVLNALSTVVFAATIALFATSVVLGRRIARMDPAARRMAVYWSAASCVTVVVWAGVNVAYLWMVEGDRLRAALSAVSGLLFAGYPCVVLVAFRLESTRRYYLELEARAQNPEEDVHPDGTRGDEM